MYIETLITSSDNEFCAIFEPDLEAIRRAVEIVEQNPDFTVLVPVHIDMQSFPLTDGLQTAIVHEKLDIQPRAHTPAYLEIRADCIRLYLECDRNFRSCNLTAYFENIV
jgi:hypothetical protein